MPYVNCTHCNKEVYKKTYQLKGTQKSFCNRYCYTEWRKIYWKGEGSPAYKGKRPQKFTCDQCHQIFFRTKPSSVRTSNNFCGQDCHTAWQREHGQEINQHLKKQIAVNCDQCGKIIERKPSQINKTNFCSRSCFGKWRSMNWKSENAPRWKGGEITVKCHTCKKSIQMSKARSRNHKRHFCNHKCYAIWKSTQTKENSPRWKGGKIIVECANCGNPVQKTRSEVENRSERFFCNTKCMGEWQSKNKTRENHPNWKGRIIVQCSYCGSDIEKERWRPETKYHFCNLQCSGKWQSENLTGDARYNWKGGRLPYYGPNWGSQRYKARERDNFTCQMCNMTDKEHIELHNQKLHVHHIKPFREFNYIVDENDNYKQANSLSNLITVCRNCHRILEHS